MNKKQSLRALRRQAEREKQAEQQRQAAAILATRDLEERKRLLAKARRTDQPGKASASSPSSAPAAGA